MPSGTPTLIVVSNREPYIHRTPDTVDKPVGGLTAAVDATMRETGGWWVAWGSGDADFTVADKGIIDVPPEDPQYQLRRIPLDETALEGYYYGYSNQVLWPLSHGLLDRVNVAPGFWDQYRAVNETFATAVADTIKEVTSPLVWFQDYHLTLAPRLLREQLGQSPRLQQFWHIPWPAPDLFARCPQAEQVLEGLLANDRLGFHIEAYRRAFLSSVDRHLSGATVMSTDDGPPRVAYNGTETTVYVSPIGVDTDAVRRLASTASVRQEWDRFRSTYDLGATETVLVGVDRLDYTKGIGHRLRAFEYLLEQRPALRGTVRLIQKGSRTRTAIPTYRRHYRQIRDRIDRVNNRFGTDDWTPITYIEGSLSRQRLIALLAGADVGLVTSIADGFNLIALEYAVASTPPDELLVSEFCGAASYLSGAVTINPHDIAGTAAAIDRAINDATVETDWDRLADQARTLDIDAWLADGLA